MPTQLTVLEPYAGGGTNVKGTVWQVNIWVSNRPISIRGYNTSKKEYKWYFDGIDTASLTII